MVNYVDQIWLTTIECCNCGTQFAMTVELKNKRLEDRKNFFCPNGHSQHFTGKSEAQRLKEELAQKTHQLEREKSRASSIAHQRDQVSKAYHCMRERVKNGVCPCCNRTFQNLMNHIKTQHPDFANHDTLRTMRGVYGMTQTVLAEEIGVAAPNISNYERNKYVPAHAKERIEEWLTSQDK